MKARVATLVMLIVLCGITFLLPACEEKIKEVAGPTEYDTLVDTTIIRDTVDVAGGFAAVTVIHEWYGSTYGSEDIFEFMPMSSIELFCQLAGIPNESSINLLSEFEWEIRGIVYIWSAESYYWHTDTAKYLGGNPDDTANWDVDYAQYGEGAGKLSTRKNLTKISMQR